MAPTPPAPVAGARRGWVAGLLSLVARGKAPPPLPSPAASASTTPRPSNAFGGRPPSYGDRGGGDGGARRSARQFSRDAAFAAAGALVRRVSGARRSLGDRLARRAAGGGGGGKWASPRTSGERDARRRAGLEACFGGAPEPAVAAPEPAVAALPARPSTDAADFLPPELMARSQALHARA